MTSEMPASPNHNQKYKNYGPPPSDSEDDDFDGMSFGQEFEEKPTKRFVPPQRTKQEIVRDQLLDSLKNFEENVFRRLYKDNQHMINLSEPVTTYSWTPLMMACQKGLSKLVRFLVVDKSVDVNRSVDTYSPLMVACAADIPHEPSSVNERITEIVKLLIEHKALVNMRNRNGETALMLAITSGFDDVVDYLIAHDASLEVSDNYGDTPLFYACRANRKRSVETLLRQGVIWDISNRIGDRPLDICITKGYEDIAKVFPTKKIEPTVPLNFLNNEGFEELVPTAYPYREKPAYAPDVYHLLRGMRLHKLEYLFYQAKIDLPQFMQLTDERLQEIGVEFPYQRDRVILGLIRLHSAPFAVGSLHRTSANGSLVELFDSISSALKSLVICESSLKFAERRDIFGEPIKPNKRTKELQRSIDEKLDEIRARSERIFRRIQKFDQITPRPPPMNIDEAAIKRIGEPNTFKRIIFKRLLSACAVGLVLAFAYKMRK